MHQTPDPRELLKFCRTQMPATLELLGRAVRIESPSTSKADVDRMANFYGREFAKLGARVAVWPHRTAGAAVWAELWGEGTNAVGRRSAHRGAQGKNEKGILVLGHHDTVWETGTIERMPFRIARGCAWGPGILDMKAGIEIAMMAIRALKALKMAPQSPVRIFLNPDEEMSSVAFRERLFEAAKQAKAALALEPAAAGGALKTARKGMGEFRVTAIGRSAHAGINPAAGVNAITELARQLAKIETFQNIRAGRTLTVGVIEGGTRSNVVPERASARIDFRAPTARDGALIEKKMRQLRPILPGARLEIEGGINRPPFERCMSRELFARAQQLASQMGWRLDEATTGGGSDGNFTAALGVPTLDGLGAVGDGAHARDEHIILRELPRRAALVAALLATL